MTPMNAALDTRNLAAALRENAQRALRLGAEAINKRGAHLEVVHTPEPVVTAPARLRTFAEQHDFDTSLNLSLVNDEMREHRYHLPKSKGQELQRRLTRLEELQKSRQELSALAPNTNPFATEEEKALAKSRNPFAEPSPNSVISYYDDIVLPEVQTQSKAVVTDTAKMSPTEIAERIQRLNELSKNIQANKRTLVPTHVSDLAPATPTPAPTIADEITVKMPNPLFEDSALVEKTLVTPTPTMHEAEKTLVDVPMHTTHKAEELMEIDPIDVHLLSEEEGVDKLIASMPGEIQVIDATPNAGSVIVQPSAQNDLIEATMPNAEYRKLMPKANAKRPTSVSVDASEAQIIRTRLKKLVAGVSDPALSATQFIVAKQDIARLETKLATIKELLRADKEGTQKTKAPFFVPSAAQKVLSRTEVAARKKIADLEKKLENPNLTQLERSTINARITQLETKYLREVRNLQDLPATSHKVAPQPAEIAVPARLQAAPAVEQQAPQKRQSTGIRFIKGLLNTLRGIAPEERIKKAVNE